MSDGDDILLAILAIVGLVILLVVVAPIVLLWAIYTILGQPFVLDFWRWVAALTICIMFGWRIGSHD